VETWNGSKSRDFERAGAGLQAELAVATTALGRVGTLLKSYATALASATQEIADAKTKADSAAQEMSKASGSTDPADRQRVQHAGQRKTFWEHHAVQVKDDLRRLAIKIAHQIDQETAQAVPGSERLSPSEIARKVQHELGTEGLDRPAALGFLDQGRAWGALAAAERAVPENAVTATGGINWKQLAKDYAHRPGSRAGTASGWAISRLVANWKQLDRSRRGLDNAINELTGGRGDLPVRNHQYAFNQDDPGGLEMTTSLFANGPLKMTGTAKATDSFWQSPLSTAWNKLHHLGQDYPWVHKVLHDTSEIAGGVAFVGDTVAGACAAAATVDGVVPSGICEIVDLPIVAGSGMASGTADLLDMATGGEKWSWGNAAWDASSFLTAGISKGVEFGIENGPVRRMMAGKGFLRGAIRSAGTTASRGLTWLTNVPSDWGHFLGQWRSDDDSPSYTWKYGHDPRYIR